MAEWLHFTSDFDYRHPSRAVTAYKAGMTEYCKDDIVKAAIGMGKAEVVEKPAERDGRMWLNG